MYNFKGRFVLQKDMCYMVDEIIFVMSFWSRDCISPMS
jgi:hypothetical protein